MSAFLGKIHFWLYNKILLHENLIDSVIELAKGKGYDCKGLIDESYARYGRPVTGELEDNIDLANIHGWLQDRIFSVEKRLAYLITELLKEEILKAEEVAHVFYQNGVSAGNSMGSQESKPQGIYTLIFDHMLEGMPCDGANEIVDTTDQMISWKTTRCLHRDHWDQAGGDVENFYQFRDNWISGFLDAMGTGFRYSSAADGIKTIRKVLSDE